ncbi:MAG: glycosyltransferase family 4 protein [Nanoarchaeota archaeon]
MKIGFLITYFYPQTGGAESNCYFLARELAKNNEVHVFCSGEEDKDEIINGIHVHRSKELLRIKYYFALYPSLNQSINRFKLDILHVHGLGFIQHDITIKNLKSKNPNLKVVCTPHGPFMALNKYNLLGSLFKTIYTPFIINSLRNYDKIIEVNPMQHIWMSKEYGIPKSKISFVPNGIPQESFKKLNSSVINNTRKKYGLENKFIISYVGRIQKYKGLDQIVKILPEIAKICPEVTFLAIGRDAEDTLRLKDLAKSLEVKDNVIFTGEVTESEKLALLDISEIFIFPSEWEAFGIVLLEAMARSNALISSRTEGGRYLVQEGKNGFLFNYGDNKELSRKLKILINNKNLRFKMQKLNNKLSRDYIWEDIAKKLEKEYRSILR